MWIHAETGLAESCRIYWVNSPVGPNQTALIAGSNFPQDPVVLIRLDANDTSSMSPMQVSPAQVTDNSVKVVLPSSLTLWAYTMQVCARTDLLKCSNELAVNKADVWWFAGDEGNTSSAGGWLRLFGTSLHFAEYGMRDGVSGRAAQVEEQLQHALRSRNREAIARHAIDLSQLLNVTTTRVDDGSRANVELRLQLGSARPVVLSAVNASLWDAMFSLPTTLMPGSYSLAVRNEFQSNWTRVSFFQPGNRAHSVVSTVQIRRSNTKAVQTFAVADYMDAYGIPSHGLNYSTGAPVNATAAVLEALADADKAGDDVDKVVLLPIGKLFIDGGPLKTRAHFTLWRTALALSLAGYREKTEDRPRPILHIFTETTQRPGASSISASMSHTFRTQ